MQYRGQPTVGTRGQGWGAQGELWAANRAARARASRRVVRLVNASSRWRQRRQGRQPRQAHPPHALQSRWRVTGCRRQLEVSVAAQWVHSRCPSAPAPRLASLMGRSVPLSFLYCPHALHSTARVSGSRRQLLVLVVPQLEQALPALPPADAAPAGRRPRQAAQVSRPAGAGGPAAGLVWVGRGTRVAPQQAAERLAGSRQAGGSAQARDSSTRLRRPGSGTLST